MHKYVPPSFAVHARRRGRRVRDFRQLRADRMREADVRDQAFAEERRDASARAIDKLIGNHEVERLVFFLRAIPPRSAKESAPRPAPCMP